MEAVVRRSDNKIVHVNGCGHGSIQSARYDYYVIPDQPIPAKWWDENRLIADLTWPDDLTRDLALEKAAIDCETGKAIDKAVHPLAGLEEQLGIIRLTLGVLLNATGTPPPPEFDQWNDAATKAIQEAAARKEKL